MPALYRGPKKGYKLTLDDRLALAASIWGETGPNPSEVEAASICWGLMMRYMLMNMRWMQEGWNFRRFIRSFSQPVNPLWLDPDGAKCLKYPEYCTPSHLARRAQIQHYLDDMSTEDGWAKLSVNFPLPVKYADMFYEGKLANPFPVPVYDFAACFLTKKQMSSGSRPGYGIDIGGSCFLTYNDLRQSERELVIEGRVTTGVVAHASAITYLALGAVGATAAWFWARFGG